MSLACTRTAVSTQDTSLSPQSYAVTESHWSNLLARCITEFTKPKTELKWSLNNKVRSVSKIQSQFSSKTNDIIKESVFWINIENYRRNFSSQNVDNLIRKCREFREIKAKNARVFCSINAASRLAKLARENGINSQWNNSENSDKIQQKLTPKLGIKTTTFSHRSVCLGRRFVFT